MMTPMTETAQLHQEGLRFAEVLTLLKDMTERQEALEATLSSMEQRHMATMEVLSRGLLMARECSCP